VSPVHLLDIKRVAFETKPVNRKSEVKSSPAMQETVEQPVRGLPDRSKIVALVDEFLISRVKQDTISERVSIPPEPPIDAPSPVRTIIHELKPQGASANGERPEPVDFVSEIDVRNAIEKGEKIYITSKTILTPAARDLGEEREVFARV
jgi:hypothetical protein